MMIGGGEPGSQYLRNKGLNVKEEMLISEPEAKTSESYSHRVPQAFQTIQHPSINGSNSQSVIEPQIVPRTPPDQAFLNYKLK